MSETAQPTAPGGYALDIAVVDQFSDKRWRMANLYYILDETNHEVKFVTNDMQYRFWAELWYWNIVLKCRQVGFCQSPSTQILTADLRWKRLDSLVAGEPIVAIDEVGPGGRGNARKMRTAIVEGLRFVERAGFRISFDDGRKLTCSGLHPWLSVRNERDCIIDWRSIEAPEKKNKLTVGSYVRWITKPWGAQSVEDGWFGGILDGEGSLGLTGSVQLLASQLRGPVFDRMERYVRDRGYHYGIEADKTPRASKFGKQPVPRISVTRMDEIFRAIGQTRPTRFIDKRWWEGREPPGKKSGIGWAKITDIEPLGMMTLVDLQTSTGTYIAEGFVSHNTSFIDLYILDDCVFIPNQLAGIIAHTIDDVKKIFRRKIKHPFERLPPEIRAVNPAANDSAQELVWANGSEISVGTTMRSGTLSHLHVSEFGYIAAKFPDKAEEIVTGSFNTVHAGSMIFVEATGYGKAGKFYEQVQSAKKLKLTGRPLSKLDFKYHFYAWWMNPKYALPEEDAKHVVFTRQHLDYFRKIERSEGIQLSLGQRAWWVKKKEINGDQMGREFPSNDKEPFEVALKGTIFSTEMQAARDAGRITKVKFDKALTVDTWWDLGRRAKTAIWFVQTIGNEYRAIWYHEDSLRSLQWYLTQVLTPLAKEHGWVYRHHVGPHDLEVTDLTSKENKTRWQIAKDLGFEFLVGKQWDADDQIDAARLTIPLMWFDEENCSEGINHLELFRYEWNENLQSYLASYRNDDNSHAASALMTGSMMLGSLNTQKPRAQAVGTRRFAT